MKFLNKMPDSAIVKNKWHWDKDKHKVREALRREQYGFCAYSEKYLGIEDNEIQQKCDIEHFDPRLKNTDQDGYENWYLVESGLNERKYKKLDNRFLPIINPAKNAVGRVVYQKGLFVPANNNDIEAQHFIDFLRLNDQHIFKARINHVETIVHLRDMLEDEEELVEHLSENWAQLSYISALEAALGITNLWQQIKPEHSADHDL